MSEKSYFVDVAGYLPKDTSERHDLWPAGPQQGASFVTRYGLSAFTSRSEYAEPVHFKIKDSDNRLHLSVWLHDAPGLDICGYRSKNVGQISITGYLPDSVWDTELHGKTHHVGLLLAPELLPELAGEDAIIFSEKLRSNNNLRIQPSNATVLRAAKELDHILLSPVSSPLLREAKSLELLAYLIAHTIEDKPFDLTRTQRERLQYARQLLLTDLAQAPTIEQLAQACGLNTFQLKQDFKRLYGLPIHALYQQERMNTAWRLLESGEASASEAARLIGYSNMSHFGTAFRRQFGMLPGELKRRLKISVP